MVKGVDRDYAGKGFVFAVEKNLFLRREPGDQGSKVLQTYEPETDENCAEEREL